MADELMSTSPALPTAALGASAEAQAAAFETDPRIHFDRQSGTWRLEDDNGDELEYDAAKGKWVPVVRILRARLAATKDGRPYDGALCSGRRGTP